MKAASTLFVTAASQFAVFVLRVGYASHGGDASADSFERDDEHPARADVRWWTRSRWCERLIHLELVVVLTVVTVALGVLGWSLRPQ